MCQSTIGTGYASLFVACLIQGRVFQSDLVKGEHSSFKGLLISSLSCSAHFHDSLILLVYLNYFIFLHGKFSLVLLGKHIFQSGDYRFLKEPVTQHRLPKPHLIFFCKYTHRSFLHRQQWIAWKTPFRSQCSPCRIGGWYCNAFSFHCRPSQRQLWTCSCHLLRCQWFAFPC